MSAESKALWTSPTFASGSRDPQAPAAAPPRKRRLLEDDFGVDLPESQDDDKARDTKRDTLEAGEDTWDPDDDSDLGLGISDDSEDVGLDTANGLEEGSDSDFDVDDMGEGQRWTGDSEESEEPHEDDDALSSGAEDGWTGDDDAPIEDENLDPELGDEADLTPDDGGVEGLDDDTDLDDFDVSSLPKLEADSDDDADGIGIEALDELGEVAHSDEVSMELVSGQAWKQLPARSIRRRELWTQTTTPGAARTPKVASVEHEGRVLLALCSDDGILLSGDAGRIDERAATRVVTDIALTSSDRGPLLWVVDDSGALEQSADLGQSFTRVKLEARASTDRVLRIAGDGARQLGVLLATHVDVDADAQAAGLRVARTSDDGGRFVLGAQLALPPADVLDFSLCRAAFLVASSQQVSCSVHGSELTELLPGARGPAVLVDEDGEVFCYACVPQAAAGAKPARTLIVRCAMRALRETPTVLVELDADFGAPRSLAASYSEGLVTLYVTNDRALHRVDASLDGEELA